MDSNAVINLLGAMVGKDVPSIAFGLAINIKKENGPLTDYDGICNIVKKLFNDTIPNLPKDLVEDISTTTACICTGSTEKLNRDRFSSGDVEMVNHFIKSLKEIE